MNGKKKHLMNQRISDHPLFYRIKVRGVLDPSWSDWFDGFTIETSQDKSILCGFVEDQASLFGTLTALNNLGLMLISVELMEEVSP